MTPRPTFSETVSKLVKAYINDELQHSNCRACVVGNLCAGSGYWTQLFVTIKGRQYRYFEFWWDYSEAREDVMSTGYSLSELASIEYAFETADKGKTEDDWMFNGLMDVVDVLADIHGIDLKEKEEAKAMFQKC